MPTPVFSRALRVFCTSPAPDAEAPLRTLIQQARRSVHVASYAWTLADLTDDLVARRQAGCEVILITDSAEASGATEAARLTALQAAGVTVIVDTVRTMHNKLLIIDGRVAVYGSFNFTQSALREDNLWVIDHAPAVAAFCEATFAAIRASTTPLTAFLLHHQTEEES